MLSFFLLPKEVLNSWISSDQDSFGTVKIKSIDWPSGAWFASQKIKGGYVFRTLR
jgi:hypothetical protein